MEFDESIDQDDIDASGLGAAQGSFGPSGFSSDLGDGRSLRILTRFPLHMILLHNKLILWVEVLKAEHLAIM